MSGVEQQVVRVEIVDSGPSVDEVLAAVRHPAAGAVAIFVGTVRDHDGGREGVVRLDYSAHPDAVEQLAAVAREVAGMPGVQRVAAVHRRGELAVGDTAVVCAVSAAHRAEAFAGCRTLIEQLKARVPIWKKQLFETGSTEWVGL
ncbi:molybdenum cofactor biosynthesis protein MoaE [Ornithinimicrobium cavernae]|uniref:molybdenum cofactor biosynthesis protein MoaE n=1 Tax=Ornithinimicrobium cavernae TaxID=2666047 RepID=UPI001F2C7EB2|nr:molybdenum cofactor biosynthesis protein MoaE [Ornithinimicrobium cavernae]